MKKRPEAAGSRAGEASSTGDRRRTNLTRRQLLTGSGLLVAGSVAAPVKTAEAQPLTIPNWTTMPGRAAGTQPYGQPSSYENRVVRQRAQLYDWSYSPLQDLHGSITPNGLFFERHHGGVPNIDPTRHFLVVHGPRGLVRRNLKFSVDDILRFPTVTRKHFLECSGNTDNTWSKAPSPNLTIAETHGLLSCSEWTGVPLKTLLNEAGVNLGPDLWMFAEGADAAAMGRSVQLNQDVLEWGMVVYAQNGERLRPEQGYPLRLLLPGYEGNMNIKWLRRLEIAPEPTFTREETSRYSDPIVHSDNPRAWRSRLFTFVMEAKSVITFPAPTGQPVLKQHGFYEIRGIAWSGRGTITRVEVSVDGGASWRDAQLEPVRLPRSLTAFTYPWEWQGQQATIMSRATDDSLNPLTGGAYVQPTIAELRKVRGLYSEYHNNAIQAWDVQSDGEAKIHAS